MKGQKRTPVPSSVPREVGPAGPVSAYGNSDAQADMTETSNADECDLLGLSSVPGTDAGAAGAPSTPEGWAADPDDESNRGLPSGLLARAEAATGADLADVRVHVDGEAAGQDAAAFAQGRDIHVNPVTLGADGEPDDDLIAHEIVHVLQQGSPEAGSGGASLEREADDGAGAILQGRDLAVEGGTGGPSVQRKSLVEWFAEIVGSEKGATWKGEDHADETDKSSDTYVGADQQVLGDDGEVAETPMSGTVTHDEHALTMDGYTQKSGTTSHSTNELGTSTTVDTAETTWGLGSFGWTSTKGTTIDAADPEGTRDAVEKALTEKADAIDAQVAQMSASIDAFDARIAGYVLDEDERAYAEVAAFETTRAELARQRDALATDAAVVRAEASSVTVENAADRARRHGVFVPEATETVGATDTESRTWDWNPFDDGEIGLDREKATETQHSGGQTSTHTKSSSTKVAVGEGLALTRSSTVADTIEDGEESYESSAETSGTGGLVLTEDGEVGAKGGASRKVKSGDVTTEVGGNLQLTNQGVSGDVSAGAEHDLAKGIKAGTKTSATGNFTVDIEEVAGGRYQLVVTIAAGASLELSGAAERGDKATGKSSASASATGSISGSMVFTHVLSEIEASVYLSDLEAAEKGAPKAKDKPEFTLLAKLALLGDQAFQQDAGAAALVDANAARQLGTGDGVSLALSANASVEAKASLAGGAMGAGLSAEGSASTGGSVTYSVKRITGDDRRPRIEISAAFSDESAWKAGVGLQYGIGKTGASAGASESHGYQATFLLDPDAPEFDLQYNKIMAASSEAELRALERDRAVAAARTSSTKTDANEDTEGHTAALGPLSGAFDTSATTSSSVTSTATGTSATFMGEHRARGAASLGPLSVEESRMDAAQAEVSEDSAVGIRFKREDSSTMLAPGPDDETRAQDLVTKSPKQNVQDLLTESESRLRSYDIDNAGFEALLIRARDGRNWDRCSEFFVDAGGAWRALRLVLISGDATLRSEGDRLGQAVRLMRVNAVVGFVAGHGEAATRILENALWHWGEDHHDSKAQADDIASMTEFPPALRKESEEYYSLDSEMERIGSMASAIDRDDQESIVWLADKSSRVNSLYTKVEASNDFVEPRAKLEMLAVLMRWQDEIDAARMKEYAELSTGDTVAAAMKEVQRSESLVRAYKGEECILFDRLRSSLVGDDDGALEGLGKMWADSWGGSDIDDAFDSLEELYESWIAVVRRLRQAYVSAGVTEGWLVSRAPGSPRELDVEPDVRTFDKLWRQHWQRYETYNMGPDRSNRAASYEDY